MNTNNRPITLSVAPSRTARQWLPQRDTWSGLCTRLAASFETSETPEEYAAADKTRRGEIKDIGGFVGGALTDNIRRAGHCLRRDIITIDIDRLQQGDEERLCGIVEKWCCCIYSTHSHTAEAPRLRLVLLPSRQIERSEYEAVAKVAASEIETTLGAGCVDSTTFEPERLMYWPSHSRGAQPYFHRFFGEPVDVDAALGTSVGQVAAARVAEISSRGELTDPRQRGGVVGATCSVYYPITRLFEGGPLAGYYVEGTHGRWSWARGSTRNGVRIYDNGLFIYSDHDTDPAHGGCRNAFDLIRIHLYGGDMDAALSYCAAIPAVADIIRDSNLSGIELPEEAEETDAADEAPESREEVKTEPRKRGRPKKQRWEPQGDWTDSLDRDDRTGRILTNASNIRAVFENDPKLQGLFRMNNFNLDIILTRPRPWAPEDGHLKLRNSDMACLRNYLDKEYGITGKEKIQDGFEAEIMRNSFNPVLDTIHAETWDGVPRVETLFIDWLGAEDTVLNRAMTRKWLVAAVARALKPGCKFDYMLILRGPEGCGKSTIFERLGGDYYTNRIGDIRTKEALENIAGNWVAECGELGSLLGAEQEYIKNFFSSRIDKFRPAYGKVVETRPRATVFCGTTNEDQFAKGATGNRRYWIMSVDPAKRKRSLSELFSSFPRNQIWAEALDIFKRGEILALPPELEEMAKAIQQGANVIQNDPWYDDIKDYLDMYLPVGWQGMDLESRKRWLINASGIEPEGSVPRTEVCFGEIFEELLHIPRHQRSGKDSCRVRAILADLGWKYVSQPKRVAKYIGVAKYYVRTGEIPTGKPDGNRANIDLFNDQKTADENDDDY